MSLITSVKEPNLWEVICKEYEAQRPPFTEIKPEVQLINYEPSSVNPVFYGKMYGKVPVYEEQPDREFEPEYSHPACIGHTFVQTPVEKPPTPGAPEPDRLKCSPREYLEHYVFPHLIPAMEAMLTSAKNEKCFERKRTKFNALDFLTEFLYKNNPNKLGADREGITLYDIPFVQKHLKEDPRPPLPLSLIWTEEEATLVIQSHWRGFLVRRQPEVQELRMWQKEWRADNENIRNKVDDFWAEKMNSEDSNTLHEALIDTLKSE